MFYFRAVQMARSKLLALAAAVVTASQAAAGSSEVVDTTLRGSRALQGSDFAATFFAEAGCGGDSFTTITAQTGFCNTVFPPSAGALNYKVSCGADRSGTISFCRDSACQSCDINTPFRSDQCLANTGPGSSSLSLTCLGGVVGATPARCNRCQLTFYVSSVRMG